MHVFMMSDDISDYYVVIKCPGGDKGSRFARLKNFILSAIANLIWRLRKRFSQIIFNGRPLCREPEDELPPGFRRLNYKKLKEIKKALSGFEAGTETNKPLRPGNLAPPPSICASEEDLEIEVIYAGDKTQPTDDVATKRAGNVAGDVADAGVKLDISKEQEPDDEEVRAIRKKLPRPKAAKGKRSDTVIPPYIIIDEQLAVTDPSCRKQRPKAAKGDRKVMVDHPIDLPAEVLLERYQNTEKKYKSKGRQRPAAPRPRARDISEMDIGSGIDDIDAEVDELLQELRTITSSRKVPKQKAKQTGHVEAAKPAKVKSAAKEDGGSEEDIFNVPYLPKSQRKHASSGLSLPWLN